MIIYHILTITPREDQNNPIRPGFTDAIIEYDEFYLGRSAHGSIQDALLEIKDLERPRHASEIWGKELRTVRITPTSRLTNQFPIDQHIAWKSWQMAEGNKNRYILLHEGQSLDQWMAMKLSNYESISQSDKNSHDGSFWRSILGKRKD